MSVPRSILIVKTSAIGDVIQTFPVLQYLRRRFPHAAIDWVAEKGIVPLLRSHPEISRVIPIDTKKWRKNPLSPDTISAFSSFKKDLRQKSYDLLFDFQGNTKSAFVTYAANAHVKVGFDWGSVKEKTNLLATKKRFTVPWEINVRNRYLHLAQLYFEDSHPFAFEGVQLRLNGEEEQRLEAIGIETRPCFMVCFGSKWPNKRLNETTWVDLLDKARSSFNASFLFIYGDEEERRIAESLAAHFPERSQCVGELSLPLWQALMWKVNAVLAVDSAALHLCATTQTPSFSVFGPSLAKIYKPEEARHGTYQGVCPYNISFATRCPQLRTCKTGACIQKLDAEALSAAFHAWATPL